MTVYFGNAPDSWEGEALVYHPGGWWSKVSAPFVRMTVEDHFDPPADWPGLVEDAEVARNIIADLLHRLDAAHKRAKRLGDALDKVGEFVESGWEDG